MSDIFFNELSIPKVHYNLAVGSASHARQTGLMLERIERVLKKENPDIALVYGDTNSTLAGALAAAKLNIPVAHIEAGLRSYNKNMPEEINRILTDHISTFLFCPTQTAANNLANEGITKGVFKVGDVMFDALLYYLQRAKKRSNILKAFQLKPKHFYLSTIHRQENTDNLKQLESILRILNEVANQGNIVVFPLHPRTKKAINLLKFKYNPLYLKMIGPVSYLDMLLLEKNARAVLTDSGGVQKEAFFLKVPCITLRNETEWVETLQVGGNTLTGVDSKSINRVLKDLSTKKVGFCKVFGDGKAAERTIDILASLLEG
jgi:UDP-N-acetylglucosamine 2-epimerase